MENQDQPLTEDQLNIIYNWVDEIPLSKPKRNISRDFSDGVLVAEVIAHFCPQLIELHNYSSANSVKIKFYNWDTLNKKVFKKLGFQISQQDIQNVVNSVPESIERVLLIIKYKLEGYQQKTGYSPNKVYQEYPDYNQQKDYQQKPNIPNVQQHNQILFEKDQIIGELRETVEILEMKIKKLENLVNLKDNKIETLQRKLQENGLQ